MTLGTFCCHHVVLLVLFLIEIKSTFSQILAKRMFNLFHYHYLGKHLVLLK